MSRARRRAGGATLLTLALLAGCGGGERETTFAPTRLLVFGDEASVITADGGKYSVNALNSDGSYACGSNRLWVQVLADQYGFGFAACNASSGSAAAATQYAWAGAGVADLAAQVATHSAASGFVGTDLVSVYLGQNDLVTLLAQRASLGDDALVSAAYSSGAALAAQVNAIAQAGAKVLVATLFDAGSTPYASEQETQDGGAADLLRRMSERFNAGLRANLTNDGTMIGLLQLDELTATMQASPSAYGLSDLTSAACTAALPDCTTETLVDGASTSTHLWADARRFGVGVHAQLGSLAVTRATNNPF